jgi:hypothetical protein|tara:strand:+ start:1790 stop:1927 length:138 start_codon:yes stop_codon:yes gene_type:complete
MDIVTLLIISCAVGIIVYLDKNPAKKAKVKAGLKTYYENLKNYFG